MIKKRWIKITVSILLFCLVIFIATSFSNKTVIQRTLFLNGYFLQAFNTEIQVEPDAIEEAYGTCYYIHNEKVNNGTENGIPSVCMKENSFGFLYSIEIGHW
ncbi:hypothetical protein GLV94_08555 [Virgibacillus halodenitrificans]|uniref:hypothetical protein n=1 Tax=Virgibacillus halodenitrificans TaxID=1482 RepID=UPI00136883EA|nr:hypothetical protein [Virgibacillus halodenitrificans]MYL45696.1 hypothetical protein [Virgibacillus halodenitrificans]